MIDAPDEVVAGHETDAPDGLVCKVCGGNRWKVTETRKCAGCIRRWRTCLSCGRKIRSVERAETDPHPDLDAA